MNNAQLAHPSRQQLGDFLAGRLTADQSAEIAGHVADCASCEQVLEELPADTLLALIRESSTVPDIPVVPATAAATSLFERLARPKLQSGQTVPVSASHHVPPELADHPRYRLLESLGSGGMGTVFKAEHRLMERRVAVKVISPRLVTSPAAVERFRREVKAAARLSHPNIVTAHDAEQAGEAHFLVMEYVEGVTLARLIAEQGPLDVPTGCDFVRQTALGLHHASQLGMVHRDIKPQNLMLTTQGQVKILDFGLAQLANELGSESPLTGIGEVLGTVDFIAPEQARDAHAADIRADLYSLGCTLYFLLTGQVPFPRGTSVQKLVSHLECRPRPLLDLRPDLPTELVQVLERMMAKEPSERFQTADAVAAALLPFCRSSSTAANAEAKPRPIGVSADRKRKRRSRPVALALAVVMLACATLVGGVVIRIAIGKGTLEIKTEDSNVDIVVKQGGKVIRIVDLESGHETTLVPGAYAIELTGGKPGLTLSADQFTLKRGDRVLVAITYSETSAKTPTSATRLVEMSPLRPDPGVPTSALFSPDQRLLATANHAGEFKLWETKKWNTVLTHKGHDGYLVGLAFSPNGSLLATAAHDKLVKIWKVPSGERLATLEGHESFVDCAAFFPDGKFVASGGHDGARVWDLRNEEQAVTALHGSAVRWVAVSPDGNTVAVAADNLLKLWNWKANTFETFPEHTGAITFVAFLPAGNGIVTVSADMKAIIWDFDGSRATVRFPALLHDAVLWGAALSRDGKTLATGGSDNIVRLWDIASRTELTSKKIPPWIIRSLAIAPDGKLLAAIGQNTHLLSIEVAGETGTDK